MCMCTVVGNLSNEHLNDINVSVNCSVFALQKVRF